MTSLPQLVEYSNQRILTTAQLAEAYETDVNNINVNFSRNKDHYTLGEDYFVLEGTDLRKFKTRNLTDCKVVGNVNKLYLWTEFGAMLHAKSLNTDKAWELYKKLVRDYFRLVQEQAQINEKPKAMYLRRREANAKRSYDAKLEGYFNVITLLDEFSYRVRFDLFDLQSTACPDGSFGRRVMQWLKGELRDCTIGLPPNLDLKALKDLKFKHIVCLDPYCEREVQHYPLEFKGYIERFWQEYYVPYLLEGYLEGSLPSGLPRCGDQQEIARIMDNLVYKRLS